MTGLEWMGRAYETGNGVGGIDYAKALEWYLKADEQNSAYAQNGIGKIYYSGGYGVEQDYEKAVEWFQKAAEQGNTWSLYMMGFCNEYGQGTEQNTEKAIEWYQKAAEDGSEEAQKALERLGM